jgi:short subunit dehydrogenase-like uncharacterized protein
MLDVVLFGATGVTGGLAARALARRGAHFALAGRDPHRLETVAARTGALEVREAHAGNAPGLARALTDVRVLLTCVGPFVRLGDTAVEAALAARVHYVDSCGEAAFVDRLVEQVDERARARDLTMATALGFDEGPADLAATLATQGMTEARLRITYALPARASPGTQRSALGILAARGRWPEAGGWVPAATGRRARWAPLPPPLGIRRSVSAPMAYASLASLHLAVTSVQTYLSVGPGRRHVMRWGPPVARAVVAVPGGRRAFEAVIARVVKPPRAGDAGRWTVLAEARSAEGRRNVVITGMDVYGLSGELLAAAALRLARTRAPAGILGPVQTLGTDGLRDELEGRGARIEVFGED